LHIRGRALNGVTGQPAEGAQVRLYPQDWTATAVVPYARVDKAGNFDIRGVAPGSYALYAAASMRDPNAPNPATVQGLPAAQIQQLIAQGLNLGGAIRSARGILSRWGISTENVSNLLPGGATGEFIFEATSPSLMHKVIVPRESCLATDIWRGAGWRINRRDGRIAANPRTPRSALRAYSGDFRVMVSPLINAFSWTPQTLGDPLGSILVKSIRYGNADVLSDGLHLTTHNPDQRLQIVLATGGKLEGVVTNDRNELMANVRVALVPDFAYRNREELYRNAITDASGRLVSGIAAGATVFAWEEIGDGAWQDAEVLRAVEGRGKMVRISEGGQAAVEIVVIPGIRQ
jgi:hypothetical protein